MNLRRSIGRALAAGTLVGAALALPSSTPASALAGSPLIPNTPAAAQGVAWPGSTTYNYDPALLYYGGNYYMFSCKGVQGDYVVRKKASSLAGLATAAETTVLTPVAGTENHNCDPSIIRGANGKFYLHYSITPTGYETKARVAEATSPDGPWTKLTGLVLDSSPITQILAQCGPYDTAPCHQYGRGQTSVARGPDGYYYLAHTDQNVPNTNPNVTPPASIKILKSANANFLSGVSTVKTFTAAEIGGAGAELSWDSGTSRFLLAVPGGTGGTRLNITDTSFNIVGRIELDRGTRTHSEGQALLRNEYGDVVWPLGQMVIASASPGLYDGTAHAPTGDVFWETHNSTALGNNTWGPSYAHSGTASALSLASNADGRLELFYVGGNAQVWHQWQTAPNGGWSAAYNFPDSSSITDVTVARNSANRLESFAVGAGNMLYHAWGNPDGSFSAWYPHQAGIKAAELLRKADGTLELFLVRTDGQVQHQWQSGTSWSAVYDFPGATGAADVTAAVNSDGRPEVFYPGAGGQIYHLWWNASGSWSSPGPMSGTASRVSAIKNQDGKVELFSVGTDNRVWHQWQTALGGPWSPVYAFDGTYATDVAAGVNANGSPEVFYTGGGGQLFHFWRT